MLFFDIKPIIGNLSSIYIFIEEHIDIYFLFIGIGSSFTAIVLRWIPTF
jgi:hypothetical protein